MKRSVSVGLLAIVVTLTTLSPTPVLAGVSARRRTTLINRVLINRGLRGTASVADLVKRAAASCQCATDRQAPLALNGLPSVDVGSASGTPGQQVTFAVNLSTAGAMVAGVQADIAFDSINAPVAATASGKPDCAVNPSIGKDSTIFGFRPAGCTGAACTAFRAIVISFSNVTPIPDGSVLYTCNVDIAPGAAAGSYPLTVSNVGMSDPTGQPITSTGTDGAILVGGGPNPTPTVTPPPGPTSKDQCKDDGWRIFTVPRRFKNQGDCIQFVNTGK